MAILQVKKVNSLNLIMEKSAKIYIAGHRGMVGSGLERKLRKEGYHNIVTRTSAELDLRNQQAVNKFFEKEKPAYVILAAAKVGGIHANNTYRAEFIYDNLMIEANIIHAAYLNKVTKLLFLGSSCIYPKMAPQPLKEEYLLSGYLEPTNQPYAIAKIAGIKLTQAYRNQYGRNWICAIPTNVFGPKDNFDIQESHVISAMITKFEAAKAEFEKRNTIVIGASCDTPEVHFAWLSTAKDNGGIESIESKNNTKAKLMYQAIDTNELFVGFAAKQDRSLMNVTFNLVDSNHKELFDQMCKEANINGVNGHRSVGGYRASIYNALEIESVKVLIDVMNELKRIV